jgi:enamine deaminase RidA (YjgF/YER057c/UK114 family)
MVRRTAFLGVPWEETGGYARAVRVGNLVDVGMTTAASPDGTILYPGDVYMQTKEALRIIGVALNEVGASFEDVIRTRMYLDDMSRWEEAARAHGEIFKTIRPTTGWVGMSHFFTAGIAAEVDAMAYIEDKK